MGDLNTVTIDGVKYFFDNWTPDGDDLTHPVCRMGEYQTQSQDDTAPGALCCRVYSSHSFTGAMWEFCTEHGKVEVFNLGEDNELWGKNWYKEISSWKCGKDIEEAQFYYDDEKYDSTGYNTYNKVPHQDVYVKLALKGISECIPGTECRGSATLFDYPHCTGAFTRVKYEPVVGTSGSKYFMPSEWGWEENRAKSVQLQYGDTLEIFRYFESHPFQSDSTTLYNDNQEILNVQCYDFEMFKNAKLAFTTFNALRLRRNPFKICEKYYE